MLVRDVRLFMRVVENQRFCYVLLIKMVVGGERTRDYPNMEKTQLFTIRQREVFADLLASAKSRRESEYSSLREESESEFIQKLALESGATKIVEKIKT